MRPTLQARATWLFAAFFGCISLVGQGLHCLVGHAFHAHAHDAAAELTVVEALTPSAAITAAGDHESHDECPICGFFAQSQAAAGRLACAFHSTVTAVHVCSATVRTLCAPDAYQSRGPPAGGTFCYA